MISKLRVGHPEQGAPSNTAFLPDDGDLAILKAVAEGAPTAEIFDKVARRIEARLPGSFCSLHQLDTDTGTLQPVAAPNLPDSYIGQMEGVVPGPGEGSCGVAAWLREPILASDIATDPNWEGRRDLPLNHGLHACWSAPVFSGEGTLLGTLAVYHDKPRECTRADFDEIEGTLHFATLAMQHACYRQELEERNRLIQGTAEAMQILVSENDIFVALSRVLSTIGKAVNVDRVYFFEYHEHPETGESVSSQRAEWVRGEIEPQLDHSGMQNFRMADLFPELDAALRRGEAGTGIVNSLTGQAREFLAEQDIRSFLLVPVVLDSVWGFMGFDDCRKDRIWTKAERAVLQSTASALGAAFVRAEDNLALLLANERFEQVAANTPGVVFQCVVTPDQELSFSYVSGGGRRAFGRDLTVLRDDPRKLDSFIHPDDQAGFWRSITEAMGDGQPWAWEGRGVDDDGRIHWVSAVGNQSMQEDGSALWHGLLLDVTEHRERQFALESSERRLSALFEHALDAILLADDDANYIDANPAVCTLLGYSREELLGLSIGDLVSPLAEDEALIGWKYFIETGSMEGEFELVRKDGATIVAEFTARASILPGVHLSILRDVTQRKQAEIALMDSEARFRHVAETAPVLIWMTDDQMAASYVSEQWLAFTGHTIEDELVGAWIEAVHPDDTAELTSTFASTFDRREPFEMEYRLRRFDGVYRWVMDNGIPRFARDGTFLGYIGTCTDIQEHKEYEEELMRARVAAEEASRLKTALLTNMSHEIRTPLTAIIGFTDILAEEVSEGQTELVSHVRLGAERLYETLNSVLDFAQLEAGAADLEVGGVDICEVVSKVAAQYHHRVAAKGLDLRVDVPQRRISACANQSALTRIALNLMSNATKFTSSGYVEMGVRSVEDTVEFRVCDSGPGISKTFFPNLFDAFRQESEGLGRNFEGNGLGLAITKRLIDAMGATLTVESDGETGTTFTVRMQHFEDEQECIEEAPSETVATQRETRPPR